MKSIFVPFVTVWEASDGREALEMCERQQPDLILSDVMMPNVSSLGHVPPALSRSISPSQLDGFGMLEAIRASPTLRMIPVIML